MNDEERRRSLEQESNERKIKKLQLAAGIISSTQCERLDWMYEQTSTKKKEDIEDELMNTAVKSQKDEDVENMKKLRDGGVAGSLFLKSATSATLDMMTKLREDPMFQIRQQELKQKESVMSNPLLRNRIAQKQAGKLAKKAKKEEKKRRKKEKKKEKKKHKRSNSSSSSSSSSSRVGAPNAVALANGRQHVDGRGGASSSSYRGQGSDIGSQRNPPLGGPSTEERGRKRDRSAPTLRGRSPAQRSPAHQKQRHRSRSPSPEAGRHRSAFERAREMRLRKEEEEANARKANFARRRGNAPLSAEEKERRLNEMMSDGSRHEEYKDTREKHYSKKQEDLDKKEEEMRNKGDRSIFKKMNQSTYMSGDVKMSDRIKSNRHRHQKGIFDPLEKE